ncbi:MAG TPA: energy transducer TonB, partial [Candidatus Polarisedimenticolaceae bacterium]|nr:energy transducer TonB [Candidatus Polarisedimenticolaceae bacterium]
SKGRGADSAERTGARPGQEAAPTEGAPLRVAEEVQAAKLISQPPVQQPPSGRGVSGKVVVHATIGKDGRVKAAYVASGPRMLHSAALRNARQRVYKPTLAGGQPVEVETEITVTF